LSWYVHVEIKGLCSIFEEVELSEFFTVLDLLNLVREYGR
jgi:hypothetical protein